MTHFIKTTPKPHYSIAGSGPVEKIKKKKNTPSLVRGQQSIQDNVPDSDTASTSNPVVQASVPVYAHILENEDAARYQQIFEALDTGDVAKAEQVSATLNDDVLMGVVRAAIMLHPRNTQVSYTALREWMDAYADLPQAQDVYKKALSLRVASDTAMLAKPSYKDVKLNKAAPKGAVAQPVEWKKPPSFAAESLWRDGQYQAVLDALKDKVISDSYVLWVKALSAYAVGDYALAANTFVTLKDVVMPEANRAAVAFWTARALEKHNHGDDAQHYYERAAQYPRSFYGILALARFDERGDATKNSAADDDSSVPAFSNRHAAVLKQTQAGLRAMALVQLGKHALAEKELQALLGNAELQQALMAYADSVGLPALSQTAMRGVQHKHASGYPAMPWKPAGGFVSDAALVAAVAWNESRFQTRAYNPSGASGVMQVLPDTAERVMAGSSARLYDPHVSVAVGDRYLRQLSTLNGIDGNLLLVIAGYNCGPGRVLQLYNHARNQAGNDPLLFIETMPIKETREYTQKVLTTYAAYRLRLGQPLDVMASLSKGEWPSYALLRTASK